MLRYCQVYLGEQNRGDGVVSVDLNWKIWGMKLRRCSMRLSFSQALLLPGRSLGYGRYVMEKLDMLGHLLFLLLGLVLLHLMG